MDSAGTYFAAKGSSAETQSAATAAPAFSTNQKQGAAHTHQQQQQQQQPEAPSPASDSQETTAAKYRPNYTLNRTKFKSQLDSQASSSSQQAEPNELLSSAIDKLYKQRLREVKAMVSSNMLEELQRDMTPEQQQSLQLVLQDLQDMQGSWEEEDDELNPAEQQLVDQITNTQIMPDDFGSYLMAMLPEGSGPAELQQLMRSLDPAVLQDIQSLYDDLKEFEQAQLDLSEAQERYIELSSRIASVTARVQNTLAVKMQQQPPQQQQQQQQPRQQQQREPLFYSEIASMAMPADQQQGQHGQQQQQEPLRFSTIAFGSSSSSSSRITQQQQSQSQPQAASPQPTSSGSSSSNSSSGWGSGWAKTRTVRQSRPLVANQSKGALFGQQSQQQQQQQPQQQQQQARVSQPAPLHQVQQQHHQQQQQQQPQGMGRDMRQAVQTKQQQQQRGMPQASVGEAAAALNSANTAAAHQQQQQQEPVRQRRRRAVIRRDPNPAG